VNAWRDSDQNDAPFNVVHRLQHIWLISVQRVARDPGKLTQRCCGQRFGRTVRSFLSNHLRDVGSLELFTYHYLPSLVDAVNLKQVFSLNQFQAQ
jgi:hypothetical protein